MLACLYSVREANDACLWLRAAGFPQYVQMYEGQFFYYGGAIRYAEVLLCLHLCLSSFILANLMSV